VAAVAAAIADSGAAVPADPALAAEFNTRSRNRETCQKLSTVAPRLLARRSALRLWLVD